MASRKGLSAAARLVRPSTGPMSRDPLLQCLAPSLSRSLATEVSPSRETEIIDDIATTLPQSSPLITSAFGLRRPPPPQGKVLTTIYSFPSMEPLRFEEYAENQLYLPLRRDILHRAVVYEGDMERQGTASTKWRSEVRGSSRKIRPQKGTGRARLGDKKSPMLVGGGVAFGPKPRDFSTGLPQKVYDLAWRTALSYRYRRGQLVVVEDGQLELELAEPRWFMKVMTGNRMGHADGRSLLVTAEHRPNLWAAVEGAGRHGKVKTAEEVDVKNLLELGRVVVEKGALDLILDAHSSDLDRTVPSAVY